LTIRTKGCTFLADNFAQELDTSAREGPPTSGARFAALVAAALVLCAVADRALAQSEARNRMGIPPSTIFKSMLRFAAIGERVKVDKSLGLLKPVIAEHETHFGEAAVAPIVKRMQDRDPRTAEQGIRSFVARDAVVLLRGIPEAPLDRARTLSRTAALEWRIVEEFVTLADPAAARSIAAHFQELFGHIEGRRTSEIQAAVDEAEKDILALFP
jgi:hypothetical protein